MQEIRYSFVKVQKGLIVECMSLVHSDSCGVWMQATGHVSLKSVGKGEGWVLLQ